MQVYVPDDLWSLLHAVRRVRPFVLFVRSSGTPVVEEVVAAARRISQEDELRLAQLERDGEYCGLTEALEEMVEKAEPDLAQDLRRRLAAVFRDKLGYSDADERAGLGTTRDPSALPETWYELGDLVVGLDGTAYLAVRFWSTTEGGPSLFAVGPNGVVRWRKELPEPYAQRTRLAWMVSGHICIWAEGQRSLLAVRAADGTTEIELARSGDFDLRDARALTCDPSGMIVVFFRTPNGGRFVRYNSRGARLPGWPGLPEDAGGTVARMDDAAIGCGWDGLIYAVGAGLVVCLDPNGERFVLALPDLSSDGTGRVGADRTGVILSFDGSSVFRCERGHCQRWLHSDDASGLLRGETIGAVAPDGTVWVAGHEGRLRRFGADRTLQWASVGARLVDAK
jgi:hypothetical protein